MSYIFSVSRVRDKFINATSTQYDPDRFGIDKYLNLIEENSPTIENEHSFFWKNGKPLKNSVSGYFSEKLSCFNRSCIGEATCIAHILSLDDKNIYMLPLCNSCNQKDKEFSLKTKVPLVLKHERDTLPYSDKDVYLYFKYSGGAMRVPMRLISI